MRTSRCQFEACGRERRYWIGYYSVNGKQEWIPVCGTHDKFIGRHNLVASGWTLEDAIRFELHPEIEIHTNGNNKRQWYKENGAREEMEPIRERTGVNVLQSY